MFCSDMGIVGKSEKRILTGTHGYKIMYQKEKNTHVVLRARKDTLKWGSYAGVTAGALFITQHATGNAQTVSQNQLSGIDLRAFSLLSMQLKMDGQCRETN